MSKKLALIIVLVVIILLSFVFFMIRAEDKNMDSVRKDYPELSDNVFSLRKEGLNIWAIRFLFTFGVPILFLTTGLAQKISIYASKRHGLFLSGIIFGIVFFGLVFLINLPLNYYSSFFLRHKYGLSDQTLLRWLELNIKGFIINNGIASLFIWVPYYFMIHNPNTWWIKLGLLAIPIIILMVFITPFVIDPFFNSYSKLPEGELREDIQRLLDKASIGDAEIFVVDKSKDTNTMNAYMTGIFNSKRIVLWDTTINNLDNAEITSIVAHEMGHYLEKHIWKNILIGILGTFIVLYLLKISSNWVLIESKGVFGFKNIYNYASLPLIILLLNLVSFFANPVENAISRYFEKEADSYEISLTEDRESAVTAMQKLYQKSLGIPRPSQFYKIWYHSHPPLEERIDFYLNGEF
ncbi:MAG: M48 family metallopeptidase [Gudongella sp.]|nr:M48 family metallopeptidase [Gudongella sp.]